jgi:hypothetical protein
VTIGSFEGTDDEVLITQWQGLRKERRISEEELSKLTEMF